ncbi:MAG: methylthioadenosine phosphorylase [Omnitrophica bacterium RIFCSPLOWO2_01_FULL_45_10]|nr:MAG: methylthioadenosine phosphorylase [Omnitrophica bacterium RIFCSPLOWO2_01_FULL_45_10]
MSKVGIIGGSGCYNIEGIEKVKRVKIKTPFGEPSDELITGMLEDREVVFLARHGKGHRVSPSEINYRANIYAMKKLGVERIISVSACGSLKKELKPLDIVIPDQFVDRTNSARKTTFFESGIVAHIQFAEPVCPILSKALYDAGRESGAVMHLGGAYVNMEGPQFSTKAESKLYRSWGMDIIGMTNLAEARLAREAEICYSCMACVTDYDCWHMDESTETVSVEMIINNLLKNVETSKNILKKVMPALGDSRTCACSSALKHAIITRPEAIPAETKKRLGLIIGKYII